MADKIMIVRHAEKPDDPPAGVDINGGADNDSLIVRGWQRAGALAVIFSKSGAKTRPKLERPKTIYATQIGPKSKSLRPQQTVCAVAAVLGITPNLGFVLGQELALAQSAEAATDPVLIGWHHEAIPAIANAILGDTTTAPQIWPSDRFDMVWVFRRKHPDKKWKFSQAPQMVLSGDSDKPISKASAAFAPTTGPAKAGG
jgi:hypothetical protein